MEDMSVVTDLLLVLSPGVGYYAPGIIGVSNPEETNPAKSHLTHELCHAHQHGTIDPQGALTHLYSIWPPSEEGQAYMESREADKEENGYNPIGVLDEQDEWDERERVIVEESAGICSRWWGVGHTDQYDVEYWRKWLEDHAPNRHEWAREWLVP